MNLKSTLIAAVCCAFSLSAFAHRVYFYNQSFDTELSDGWTLTGGSGESDGNVGYIVTGDGSGNITYTKDFSSPLNIPNFESGEIVIAFSGNSNTKVKINLNGSDGSSCTLASEETLVDDPMLTSTIKVSKIETGKVPQDIKKISVVLDGAKEGSMCVLSSIVLQSGWNYPTINKSKDKIVIEAEDFDEGERGVAYYTRVDGRNSKYRKDAPYIELENEGYRYSNGWMIQNNGIGWQQYELNEPITVESAKKSFGQWYNYTIKVEEDCDVNITIGAGAHFLPYNTIVRDGCKELDFTDLGHKLDWVKRYTCSWVLSLDNNNLRGTQTKRYLFAGGLDVAKFKAGLDVPSNWEDTHVMVNGQKLTNDTLWVWPAENNIDNSYLSWAAPKFDQPHYKNVHLTKGTHVLKLQSLASQWAFDYIWIEPVGGGSVVAVEAAEKKELRVWPNPTVDVVNFGSEPVGFSIVNLGSGATVLEGNDSKADVSGLAAGIYVVRTQDGKVAKFIKK